jgi:hypothetical protein
VIPHIPQYFTVWKEPPDIIFTGLILRRGWDKFRVSLLEDGKTTWKNKICCEQVETREFA